MSIVRPSLLLSDPKYCLHRAASQRMVFFLWPVSRLHPKGQTQGLMINLLWENSDG